MEIAKNISTLPSTSTLSGNQISTQNNLWIGQEQPKTLWWYSSSPKFFFFSYRHIVEDIVPRSSTFHQSQSRSKIRLFHSLETKSVTNLNFKTVTMSNHSVCVCWFPLDSNQNNKNTIFTPSCHCKLIVVEGGETENWGRGHKRPLLVRSSRGISRTVPVSPSSDNLWQ